VPDVNTFVNLGLNGRPVFFGCDAGNASASSSSSSGSAQTALPPLIVYIPNAPYSYMSNVSTFQMDYAGSERAGIIENGYNVGMCCCTFFSSIVCFATEKADNTDKNADISLLPFSYDGQWHHELAVAYLRRVCDSAPQFQ
jgi:hypothetical protein